MEIVTRLNSKRFNIVVALAIFLLALSPRLFVWSTDSALSTSDYDDYREHGAELFNTGIISDPHLMPGYAVLTQIFGPHFGIIVVDITLSALTCVLMWWLSGYLFNDRIAAILGGIAGALHPNLILTSASGLTEPSFTFLFLTSLVLCYKEKYFFGSVVLILSILIRPSFDYLAPLLIFVFAVITHGNNFKFGLRKVGIYGLCYIVLMSPWWIHNLYKYDSFIRLNLADGYVLYSGNNPHTKTGEGIGSDLGTNDPILSIENPLQKNQVMKKAAFDQIIQNPGRFIELSALRFVRFWHVETGSNLTVYLLIHPFSIGFATFLIFGFKHKWRATLPLVLCVTYLTAVHTFLISTPRYQLPVLPIVIVLGVSWIIARARFSTLWKRSTLLKLKSPL